jgi:single-strand DNA-binding protein
MTMSALGYLVADPLYKPAEGQKQAYARFRIMHNPFGKKQNGDDLDPIAVNISVYGKTAETVDKYAKKGTQVLVQGRVTSNALARDKDGKLVQTKGGDYIINLDMTATDLTLVGSKSDNPATESTSSNGSTKAASAGAGLELELSGPF